MKIAVNTRLLLHNKLEGIGRFSYETLKRCVAAHPEHEFHFMFDRPYHPDFIFEKNVIPHILFPPTRHPLLWYIWFEWRLPTLLRKINADLFISTDGYLSLNTTIPTHLTIHDISFEHYPAANPKSVSAYYKKYVPQFANHARQIAVVSEFTKQDVHQHYQTPLKKMDVVYNGISSYFQPIADLEKIKIRKEITNGNPFFICVSSLHPRKNVINLLKAFEQFKTENNLPHQLVLVGDFMFAKSEFMNYYEQMKFKNEVILTGNMQHEKISQLLAAADAMVYVSIFEGFGIPIVESMSCGVPVITSNVSSMPEVAADAALLVNPFDINEIAAAMKKIISDSQLKEKLIEKGFQRQQNFSWDKTASLFWQSVEKCF